MWWCRYETKSHELFFNINYASNRLGLELIRHYSLKSGGYAGWRLNFSFLFWDMVFRITEREKVDA